MSDVEAWDADDFEPELPELPALGKWEGEDEDDNVKDNWEDDDDEEAAKSEASGKEKSETQAYQRPKKKPLAERIAEKQAQKQKEEEEAKENEQKKELTVEEKLAEKIRIQKIQEKDSLDLAKGLFGVPEKKEGGLDSMLPSTAEDFEQFREALKNKITFFEDSPHYQSFLSRFLNSLAVDLGVEEVKKLGISLNSLYHEKERQRKETEKKKKKKSKVNIKLDRADDFDLISDATGGSYYDDDDFI